MANHDRYVIQETYAGGNGPVLVSRSQDRHLNRQVIVKRLDLKLIPPEHKQTWIERFQREGKIGRSFQHPHIATVYDVHQDEEYLQIVMEYVKGHTLREYLNDPSVLTPRLVADLVQQICNALASAHLKGLAHRHIKPEKIIVVEETWLGRKRYRAKLLDFGLSFPEFKIYAGHKDSRAYVAPEEIAGKPVSQATDIYSLAMVFGELLMGIRPAQTVDREQLVQELQREMPPIRRKMPETQGQKLLKTLRGGFRYLRERFGKRGFLTLPHVFAGALNEDPSQRPSAQVFGRMLTSALKKQPWMFKLFRSRQASILARRTFNKVIATVGITASILTTLAFFGFDFAQIKARFTLNKPVVSIAVIDFSNESGREDAAWISKYYPFMLSRYLSLGNHLSVVPDALISDLLKSESLDLDTGPLSEADLAVIQSRLGADYVVRGAYNWAGENERLTLSYTLQRSDGNESEPGESLSSDSGTLSDLNLTAQRIQKGIRKSLGIPRIPIDARPVAVDLKNNITGARAVIEGRAALLLRRPNEALSWFKKAALQTPGNPYVHVGLSEAYSARGRSVAAKEHAGYALAFFEQSGEQGIIRDLAEARCIETQDRWREAAVLYKRLWDRHGHHEYALHLIRSQIDGRNAADALSTIETLLPQLKEHHRVTRLEVILERANAYDALHDDAKVLIEAESVLNQAKLLQQEKHLALEGIMAAARKLICHASLNLGTYSKSNCQDICQDELDFFQEVGDDKAVGMVYSMIGLCLANQYRTDEAMNAFQKAADAFSSDEETYYRRGHAEQLNNMANLLMDQLNFARLEAYYAEKGEDTAEALRLRQRVGDLERQARDYYDQARQLATQSGAQEIEAVIRYNLACLIAELENPQTALPILADLKRIFDRPEDSDWAEHNRYLRQTTIEYAYFHHAVALQSRGGVRQIHLDKAAADYHRGLALACAQDAGGSWYLSYDLVRYARFCFDRADPEQAGAVLQAARNHFPEAAGSWSDALPEMLAAIDNFLDIGVDWVVQVSTHAPKEAVTCDTFNMYR